MTSRPVSTWATTPKSRLLVAAVLVLGISASSCAKRPESGDYLKRGNALFEGGDYIKAEKEYREVLRLAPDNPEAMRQLAIIYQTQGQFLRAFPLLRQVVELKPDDLDLQLALADTYFVTGNRQPAREAALMVLEKEPGRERALVLLVESAPAEEADETRKIIEKLREKDQDRASYYIALGDLDVRQKQYDRAESEFKAALNLEPKSATAYSGLGAVYWDRNDLTAAEEAYRTSAELAPPRSRVRFAYVEFLLRTGAITKAKNSVDDLIRTIPDSHPGRVYLMRIACAENRDENCLAKIQDVLAQDSSNYDALFMDGLANLAKGDASKAIREFEYLSNTYTLNHQVRYQLALAYLLFAKTANSVNSRNATENAENRLGEAIKLDPLFEPAVLLFAELKIAKGSAAAALEPLTRLTRERPQSARAHNLLAAAHLAQRNVNEALAIYRRMEDLFPKDPQPSYMLGTLLAAQRDIPNARKSFEKSLQVSSDYLPAVESLINLDIADQQYAVALDRAQRQIEKDSTRALAWAIRGKVYFAQKDFERAEADLLKAIELEPKLEAAHLVLAQLYAISNREDRAIERLNSYIAETKSIAALMQLGMVYEQVKNYPAARDTYERLLGLNPNLPAALNNLAVLYADRFGQLDAAQERARKARELLPNDPSIADTLGWIAFKRGDYNNALPLLSESAGKLPSNPEIVFHLGMANYMLGQEEPARVALQKANEASVEFVGKSEIPQRLALLALDPKTINADGRKELQSFLRERANDPVALVRLARIQESDGAVDQAIKTYEKLVDSNPLFTPALRELVVLYSQRSIDTPKAYDLALKARQAFAQDPDVAKTLGILSYRREYYPRAAELLQEVAAKRKDDPEVVYYLGQVHHQLKQWKECKATLERAISLKLAPSLAADATRSLAECNEMIPQ